MTFSASSSDAILVSAAGLPHSRRGAFRHHALTGARVEFVASTGCVLTHALAREIGSRRVQFTFDATPASEGLAQLHVSLTAYVS